MKESSKNYTLNKAAKILGVHRDTIMYWEENSLIPKARRNPANNYRIYNEEEIWEIAKLRGISVVDMEVIEREKEAKKLARS